MLLSLLIGRKVYAVTFSSANMVDLLWLMYVIRQSTDYVRQIFRIGTLGHSALCRRPVTHAQTLASYSALYRFGRLSLRTCVKDCCLHIDLVHVFASSYGDNKLIFVFHL